MGPTLRSISGVILGGLALVATSAAQARYTPTEFVITVHAVELSSDGTTWASAFSSPAGYSVDLADPNAFGNAFGAAQPVPAGTYSWIRMTLGTTLIWSHPAAPVSLSQQPVTVNGPPGPQAGQMTAYFASHEQGGNPEGDATLNDPLLLGASAAVPAGGDVELRVVAAITGTLIDQGGGSYDLGPPSLFFVAENGSAARVAGRFTTVLYHPTKRVDGGTIEAWSQDSGHGVLVFDGAGSWTWNGQTNEYDLLGSSGALHNGVMRSGRYGVNADGSIWMIAAGEPGTLHGAISTDGSTFLATIYDSVSSHLMLFGVREASAAAQLTGDYAFTLYGTRYDPGLDRLTYSGAFGTVTGNGTGGISGVADTNRVEVDDPTGTPSALAPATTLAETFSDSFNVSANGTFASSNGGMQGAITASGAAACMAGDFASTYSPVQQFGFMVATSPAGTFSAASLNGTYFGTHAGDRYDTSGGGAVSTFYSGFFRATFDGQGSATVTVLENREGSIETNTFAQSYGVDSATGIVTLFDPGNTTGDLKGAIGPGAATLILSSEAEGGGQPNEMRFLGLGLKQN